jgi:hypothetical protein
MQGSTGLRIAAIFYILLGIYTLAFPVAFDPAAYPFYIIGVLSIVAGAGAILVKKWGLWIAVLLFPVMLVLSIVTLYYSASVVGFYPDWQATLFHLSLIGYLVLAVLAFLLIVDKKREFK